MVNMSKLNILEKVVTKEQIEEELEIAISIEDYFDDELSSLSKAIELLKKSETNIYSATELLNKSEINVHSAIEILGKEIENIRVKKKKNENKLKKIKEMSLLIEQGIIITQMDILLI